MLYLYVAVGGAFGALGRYLTMSWVGSHAISKAYPFLGTLCVNILGSFLLGLLIGVIAVLLPRGRELHALIAIGALGSFTTFSTFAMDLYLLVEKGLWVQAGTYLSASVIFSVLAFFLGMWVLRSVAL